MIDYAGDIPTEPGAERPPDVRDAVIHLRTRIGELAGEPAPPAGEHHRLTLRTRQAGTRPDA